MKKLLCLILALIFAAGLLSGCQPTPEEDIVISKENDGWAEAHVDDPSDLPDLGVPETWQHEFSGNGLEIKINAEIDFMDDSTFPIYVLEKHMFTQDEADTIMDAIIGDAEFYTTTGERTKADVERDIENYTEELEHAIKVNNEDHIRWYSDRLQELMKEKETVLNGDVKTPASRELKFLPSETLVASYGKEVMSDDGKSSRWEWTPDGLRRAEEDGNTTIEGLCDIHYGNQVKKMGFYICNRPKFETGSYVKFQAPQTWEYAEDRYRCDTPMSENEAISMGNSIMDKLGIDYELIKTDDWNIWDEYNYTLWYSKVYPQTRYRNINTPGGLYIDYTDKYGEALWQEEITITVTADGITEFSWTAPTEITSIESENTKLLSWTEISGIIEKGLLMKNLWHDQEHVVGRTLEIKKITLSYMQVKKKDDSSERYYIPVWDVVGEMRFRFEDDYDPAKDGGGGYVLDENMEWTEFRDECVLTVNAIDGSIIDRSWGV